MNQPNLLTNNVLFRDVVLESGDNDRQGAAFLKASAAQLRAVAINTGDITEEIEDSTDGILVEAYGPKQLLIAGLRFQWSRSDRLIVNRFEQGRREV